MKKLSLIIFVPDGDLHLRTQNLLPTQDCIWYKISIEKKFMYKERKKMTVYSNDANIMLSQAEIDKLIKQMEAEKEQKQ
jgi:hypothetical protein